MRIIRGKYRTRVIPIAKNFRARPTTDFAKENLFNVLENWYDFEGLKVLDLFAGTGSMGFEFASRGCSEVYSVEKNFVHFKYISDLVKKMKMEEVTPIKSDVFAFLNACNTKFDIIFADPPYDLENIPEIPQLILERDMLAEKGTMIIEHPAHVDLTKLQYFSQKRAYGSVNFSIFEN